MFTPEQEESLARFGFWFDDEADREDWAQIISLQPLETDKDWEHVEDDDFGVVTF